MSSKTTKNPMGKIYKCDREGCDRSFRKPCEIKKHLLVHFKGINVTPKILASKKIYECDEAGCNEAYTRRWSLTSHKQRKHSNSEIIQENNDEQMVIKNKKTHYRCDKPDCYDVFMLPERLERHKLLYHCGERPFRCDFVGCDKNYKIDAHLKRHKLASHSPATRPVMCCGVEDCGKIYYNKCSLKNHIVKVHTFRQENIGKPYNIKKKCDIEKRHKCDEPGCDAAFRRPYRLKNHKLTFHGGEKPFYCDHEGCDKKYTNNSHLKRHRLLSHTLDIDTAELVVNCGVEGCRKMYSTKHNLRRHLRIKHPNIFLMCEKSDDNLSPEDKFIEQSGSSTKEKYPCNEPGCYAIFTRSYRLKNHKLTLHSGERPFKCVFGGCGRTYTNESHLTRHKSTSHYQERDSTKLIICELQGCGRTCSTQYSLKKHIYRNHTDFPFSCTECDEKFKRKSRLHAHKTEAHGREVLYKCDRCPRIFIQYRLYNKHLGNHKKYQCDCEETFEKWSKLLKHRKDKCTVRWKEHKCTTCGKGFNLKQNLMLHFIMVHKSESEINMHKCPYITCKQSYKYKWNLDYHVKSFHETMLDENEVKYTEFKIFLDEVKNTQEQCEMASDAVKYTEERCVVEYSEKQ